jgi:hypothetical protein
MPKEEDAARARRPPGRQATPSETPRWRVPPPLRIDVLRGSLPAGHRTSPTTDRLARHHEAYCGSGHLGTGLGRYVHPGPRYRRRIYRSSPSGPCPSSWSLYCPSRLGRSVVLCQLTLQRVHGLSDVTVEGGYGTFNDGFQRQLPNVVIEDFDFNGSGVSGPAD